MRFLEVPLSKYRFIGVFPAVGGENLIRIILDVKKESLTIMSEIRDVNLWESGKRKIEWVKRNMPLLNGIEKEFAAEQQFHRFSHSQSCA